MKHETFRMKSCIKLYKNSLNHSLRQSNPNFEMDFAEHVIQDVHKLFFDSLFETKPIGYINYNFSIEGKLFRSKHGLDPIIRETAPWFDYKDRLESEDIVLALTNPFELPNWITKLYPPNVGKTTKLRIMNSDFCLKYVKILHNNKIKLIPLFYALYDSLDETTKFESINFLHFFKAANY